jgi:hypothetical protein
MLRGRDQLKVIVFAAWKLLGNRAGKGSRAEWLERLAVNVAVPTVLGSIPDPTTQWNLCCGR